MTTARMASSLTTSPKVARVDATAWQDEAAPSVHLNVPADRDYAAILQQTKKVYDQLLIDKHEKLMVNIMQQKSEFDKRCEGMARKGGAQSAQALEYGVRAQEALNKLQKQNSMELEALKQDYQEKLLTMQHSMEAKWRSQHPQ